MIEQTKKCEAEYLKSLKEKLLLSSFDHSKSLDKDLEEIEEYFRNPNLLIQSIKEMQQRQEESLKEYQLKLKCSIVLHEHLKKKTKERWNIRPF